MHARWLMVAPRQQLICPPPLPPARPDLGDPGRGKDGGDADAEAVKVERRAGGVLSVRVGDAVERGGHVVVEACRRANYIYTPA